MPDLMQILFDYIIENTHEIYCQQTRRASYQVQQNRAYNELWDQLTASQRELFEEYDYFTNQMQTEELYAMFLAAFDQSAALSRLTDGKWPSHGIVKSIQPCHRKPLRPNGFRRVAKVAKHIL